MVSDGSLKNLKQSFLKSRLKENLENGLEICNIESKENINNTKLKINYLYKLSLQWY